MASRTKKKHDNVPSAFVQTMDAGGQLIQETNISVMLPHHVASQRGKLDDMTFPAVQIEDALPLVLHQAMADLVWGYMITEPIKISSYGEPGGTGPHMTDVKRKKLARYEFVIENLPFAFEEMLISGTDSFCKLAALDVGKDRKKRKAISKAMAKHGEAKINRTDPVRALAGFSGYIRALSEAVMDLQIKFDVLFNREQTRLRLLREKNHEAQFMDEFESELETQVAKLKLIVNSSKPY